MSMEPPLHEPASKAEEERDYGDTLVKVGYILIAADVVLFCYLFIALRDVGVRWLPWIMIADLVIAVVLIVVGMNMRKKAAHLGQ